MPRYRVSYTRPDGSKLGEYVEGPSTSHVRARLEAAQATDVRFHTEDLSGAAGRNLAGEADISIRSKDEIAKRIFRERATTIGFLLLVNAWAWLIAGGLVLRAGAVLLTLFLVARMILSAVAAAQRREMTRAFHWHDWPRVLRLLTSLERNPFGQSRMATYANVTHRATAWAATNRLPQALDLLDAAAPSSGVSPALLDLHRSELYVRAHRIDEALAFRRRAVANDTSLLPTLAILILRHGGDIDEARRALAAQAGADLSEVVRARRELALGLLSSHDGLPRDALAHFDEARAVFHRELAMSPAAREAMVWTIDAHRALALAELGEGAWAASILDPLEPYLRAVDQRELLAKCRARIEEAKAKSVSSRTDDLAPPDLARLNADARKTTPP